MVEDKELQSAEEHGHPLTPSPAISPRISALAACHAWIKSYKWTDSIPTEDVAQRKAVEDTVARILSFIQAFACQLNAEDKIVQEKILSKLDKETAEMVQSARWALTKMTPMQLEELAEVTRRDWVVKELHHNLNLSLEEANLLYDEVKKKTKDMLYDLRSGEELLSMAHERHNNMDNTLGGKQTQERVAGRTSQPSPVVDLDSDH